MINSSKLQIFSFITKATVFATLISISLLVAGCGEAYVEVGDKGKGTKTWKSDKHDVSFKYPAGGLKELDEDKLTIGGAGTPVGGVAADKDNLIAVRKYAFKASDAKDLEAELSASLTQAAGTEVDLEPKKVSGFDKVLSVRFTWQPKDAEQTSELWIYVAGEEVWQVECQYLSGKKAKRVEKACEKATATFSVN